MMKGVGDIIAGQNRRRLVNRRRWGERSPFMDRGGSILAAAKELGMRYRVVWGKIKASEERLGQPLVIKHLGGAHGGGSELTPFGKALLVSFRRFRKVTKTTSDALFRGLFIPGVANKGSLSYDEGDQSALSPSQE